jgi:hypothetical protein
MADLEKTRGMVADGALIGVHDIGGPMLNSCPVAAGTRVR